MTPLIAVVVSTASLKDVNPASCSRTRIVNKLLS
jgi:hypothetical protein